MSHTRPRKTDRGVSDYDALVRAIKDIFVEKKSIRATAVEYKIPRISLSRYLERLRKFDTDIATMSDDVLKSVLQKITGYAKSNQVFTVQQEDALLDYILMCGPHYHGLTIIKLRELAYQFACKMNIEYPLTWDEEELAGQGWYYGFIERHKTTTTSSSDDKQTKRDLMDVILAAKAASDARKQDQLPGKLEKKLKKLKKKTSKKKKKKQSEGDKNAAPEQDQDILASFL